MDKDQKIKNAAKYWYDCEQEGFPKSQKEVFKEWLEKDIEHKQAYNKLKRNSTEKEQELPKENKLQKIASIENYLKVLLLLGVLFTIVLLSW